jgi:hypothetical protein
VALRANREEGMEALRTATDSELTSRQPILHPSARRLDKPATRWGAQGLRLAASIALVAVVGIWGASNLVSGDSVKDLATAKYVDTVTRPDSRPVVLTADGETVVKRAASMLADGLYHEGLQLLEGVPDDDEGKVRMYRGMSQYFLRNYEEALLEFAGVGETDSGVRHQASWYQANALLALDRPFEAQIVLGQLRNERDHGFQPDAAHAYQAACDAMGISCTASNN